MNPTARIKAKALELGFSLVGITGNSPQGDLDFYEWWLGQGYAANMHYLKSHLPKKRELTALLPGLRSVVVCAARFPGAPPVAKPEEPAGKVARYAVHEDYHRVLQPKLEELAHFIDSECGVKEPSRAYVDSGAVPERALARQAGLGWIGKNAMLIHPEEGSWFWLGTVLTQAELERDAPITDHCGKCRKCLDACPTNAILEEVRAIDSRRCIAYLNIEHRGPIAEEFHKPMGDWLLGCDICQEVCPWNEKNARTRGDPPQPEWIPLSAIAKLTEAEFAESYGNRAVERARLKGLKRNAAILLKNQQR